MNRNNIKQRLFKMAKAGEVERSRHRGRYIHPDRRDLDNRAITGPIYRDTAERAPVIAQNPPPITPITAIPNERKSNQNI